MPNTFRTTPYQTDGDVIALLKARSAAVVPREAAFRVALARMPGGVPSPYGRSVKWLMSYAKIGLTFAAVLLLVGGAALSVRQSAAPAPSVVPSPEPGPVVAPSAVATNREAVRMSNPNDTSDAAIDQDVQALDTQLQGLDSDVASAQNGQMQS